MNKTVKEVCVKCFESYDDALLQVNSFGHSIEIEGRAHWPDAIEINGISYRKKSFARRVQSLTVIEQIYIRIEN